MAEKEKDTAIVPVESTAVVALPKNPGYWGRVHGLYTMAFRIFLIALPLYVVVFMAICARAFTYESVFCFFKDLQATTSFVTSDYESVTYTYEEGDNVVLSYRGGVAAVTKKGIEIYSPDGERLFHKSVSFTEPRAVSSRKYLIAYDLGGTGFTVTNTYTNVHEGQTEFPIYMAEAADTGHFALITSSDTHLSQVLVYDSNFNLIQHFKRSVALTGVAISENGKHIALMGLAGEGGRSYTQLELYRLGETAPNYTLTFEGEAPLSLDFTDDRHVVALTDGALRVFDLDGNREQMLTYTGTPVAFDSNEGGCALVLLEQDTPATRRFLVLDKKGKKVHEEVLTDHVKALSLSDTNAFLLVGEQLLCVSMSDGSSKGIFCEAGAVDLVAISGTHTRVIYPGEARLYVME